MKLKLFPQLFIPRNSTLFKFGFWRKASVFIEDFLRFIYSWMFSQDVLSRTRITFQVLNSVISLNPINMMNNLASIQMSSNAFFHYQSMLSDIPLFTRKWVVWLMNINIATSLYSAPLPIRRLRTTKMWGIMAHFSECFTDKITMMFSSFIDSARHIINFNPKCNLCQI